MNHDSTLTFTRFSKGDQELFFGHETQVNVNIVEMVTIPVSNNTEDNELEKCYLSPTKRRGVERRSLIWSPTGNGLLGDRLNCGIPHTCSKAECPICRVFGGLITSATEVEGEKRPATTLIGRLTHSGGVAIQALGTRGEATCDASLNGAETPRRGANTNPLQTRV